VREMLAAAPPRATVRLIRYKLTTLLLVSVVLAACSAGSSSSNEAPSTPGSTDSTESVDSTESTMVVTPLPEGFDPTKEENYRQAAINIFQRLKNAHAILMSEVLKNDYGNPAWGEGISRKAAALSPVYKEFEALKPSSEYIEQDKVLMASMKNIADLGANLRKTIEANDLDAAREVVHDLQDEGNRLSEHIVKFFATGGPAPTTTTTTL
jgi:hypothetical protein